MSDSIVLTDAGEIRALDCQTCAFASFVKGSRMEVRGTRQTKRKRILIGLASVPLLTALAYVCNLLGDRVNEHNYSSIRIGMNERQVEAILGRWQEECFFARLRWPERTGIAKQWVGDQYTIIVWLD